MVSNSISKKAAEKSDKIVEFKAGEETVKLSPSIIKRYLVNGNGAVTDQEVVMFLNLCRFQHLNPFLREAYLIKYGSSPATLIAVTDLPEPDSPTSPRISPSRIVRDTPATASREREWNLTCRF